VILVLEEDDRRFQARSEKSVGFQSSREFSPVEMLAMRTGLLRLLGFNHDRFDFGKFRDLSPDNF
jgi:hypothetical protein